MQFKTIPSYFKHLWKKLTHSLSKGGASVVPDISASLPFPRVTQENKGSATTAHTNDSDENIWPTIDPLRPFFRDAYGEYFPQTHEVQPVSDENNVVLSHLEKEGRPMDVRSYNNKFHELICKENFLHADKEPVLEKIWQDAQAIHQALLPLREFGVKYYLDLTGGAVRDFILGRHDRIKDLDFMVSISMFDNGIYAITSRIEELFSSQELEAVAWNAKEDGDVQVLRVVQLFLGRHQKVEKSFVMKDLPKDRSHDYEQMDGRAEPRLTGVVKLAGHHYAHDILLTPCTKTSFLNEFDFDLCKASLCLVNMDYKKDFPPHHSHLVSRFAARPEFFADIINKKITYDCDKKRKSQIHWSVGTRLPRLLDKYPEYELLATGFHEDRVQYVQAFHLKDMLEKKLASTPAPVKSRRTKI